MVSFLSATGLPPLDSGFLASFADFVAEEPLISALFGEFPVVGFLAALSLVGKMRPCENSYPPNQCLENTISK